MVMRDAHGWEHGRGEPAPSGPPPIRVVVVADGALARDTFVGALEQVPDLGPVGCDLDHGALTACWARR